MVRLVATVLVFIAALHAASGTLDAINALREGAAGAARRAVDTVRDVIIPGDSSSEPAPTFEVPVEVGFPSLDYQKHKILTAPTAILDGKEWPLNYNTLLRTGDKANPDEKYAFGQHVAQNGDLVYETAADGRPAIQRLNDGSIVGAYSFSQSPDFTSLLPVGDRLFSFVHFESFGPFQAYFLELKQDKETCKLSVISSVPTNFSDWGGLWTPCAGSVSPWNTHLGSEEYEPNGLAFTRNTIAELRGGLDSYQNLLLTSQMKYFGKYPNTTTLADIKTLFKPYKYGYATEMTAYANGTNSVKKHYALGRMAWELPYVLPDNVTVYGGDDGDNTMMTMFKAAKPGDLSCGTLYAAAVTQLTSENGGTFDLSWIDLGFACEKDLIPLANTILFTDMFETAVYDATTNSCPAGFTPIFLNNAITPECLKVKPGQEINASRFETRRYAAIKGATTEFSKYEGITFSPNNGEFGQIYIAISRVENGMEDNRVGGNANPTFDRGGKNSIKLPYNRCGCVYTLDVNQTYVAQKMSALICGNTATNTDNLNACDKKSISSPDNLSMMRGYNKLIIGEDTGTHQNDVIWLYDFADKSLKRLQTTPYGSETTSPYWYENINGCAYFVSVVQHPYEESDSARITDNASTGRAGYVGYLGPLKASTRKAPIRAPFKAEVVNAVVDEVQAVTDNVSENIDTIQTVG
ncbi:hypothetical protein COCSUDRAFT_42448 [Coccomyxa subellipsoidea C-169]|uniref:Alkaline phosphatase n=1 Tax=Coccomyxa subellipsoidea (strain C-169) TaxID=574566 RepID=I0YWU2_COCSC|nr:hypothetical protein COCSUDRAFT_42448 [Coccomyxa subellipsoidea C-169]EIE22861.1 hypothetical protein COCSUDRAFT_42448 [Coccomyxa subellipsoidea C-169]|eukprot:XP_005647405.1 hypothetical protein COCSUDRAFT_42448 [Coccomyxa subellipsoidea C-169]